MIYQVNLSDGTKVRIDSEELTLIQNNPDEFMIQVKQAIIRPAFITSIIPTGEDEYFTKKTVEMIGGKAYITEEKTEKKLRDLMNDVPQLPEPVDVDTGTPKKIK